MGAVDSDVAMVATLHHGHQLEKTQPSGIWRTANTQDTNHNAAVTTKANISKCAQNSKDFLPTNKSQPLQRLTNCTWSSKCLVQDGFLNEESNSEDPFHQSSYPIDSKSDNQEISSENSTNLKSQGLQNRNPSFHIKFSSERLVNEPNVFDFLDENNNDSSCINFNRQRMKKCRTFGFRTSSFFSKYLLHNLIAMLFLGTLISLTPSLGFAFSKNLPYPRSPPFSLVATPRMAILVKPQGSPVSTGFHRQMRSLTLEKSNKNPFLMSRVPGPSSAETDWSTNSDSGLWPYSDESYDTGVQESSIAEDMEDSLMNRIASNETLSAEEFSSILERFQMDALKATRLAHEYGLLKDGAKERLEEMMREDGILQGSEGGHDEPVALPITGSRSAEDESGLALRSVYAPPLPEYAPPPSNSHASDRQWSPVGSSLSSATRRFFLGDQNMCYSGSCEFFLMCWLSGGLIEEGCGGILFACCSRRGRSNLGGSHHYRDEPRGFTAIEPGFVHNDPVCGLTDTDRIGAQRRVVGGTESGFGSFPWMAYIRIGSSRCGGSLINRLHVVTAGHCVARARPSQIRVTLGDYVLNSDVEPLSARVYRASDIKVHPRFRFTPQADRYDVAVIKLDVPVHYEPHISPICLPEKGTDFLGHYGWAAGWGALQPGSRLRPKTLQTVDVPVIDSQLCENWHRQKGINVIIYEEMMCAGYTNGGKDSCQGDSGGPLNMNIDGRWYLAGLVSAGYSCARDRQPGIYHRVAYTADWISWAASQ